MKVMQDNVKQELEAYGVKIDEGIQRFSGREDLYMKFLMKFESDPNYQLFLEAYKQEDYENAIKYIHTLKGVSGNLSLHSLYELSTQINNLLKQNQFEQVNNLIPELISIYQNIISILQKNQ